MIKYVSLYSGCGGLDYGFNLLNFDLIFSNDIDSDSCDSFNNFYNHKSICADFMSVKNNIPNSDVIIGGPPCQSFSFLGKRDPSDPRGKELFNFINLIKEKKPKVFVMENVPGLKSTRINNTPITEYLSESFNEIGYKTTNILFDCSKYLIPQIRKRQILIGWKKRFNKPVVPELEDLQKILGFPNNYRTTNVEDALSDLPRPRKTIGVMNYKCETKNHYQKYMRKGSNGISHHNTTHMSPLDKVYIEYIPPGGNYRFIPDEVASQRVKRIKKTGGRTTTYGRLDPKGFSATVNTYFDRPNVGTNYHYSQKRLITAREAMRLQSFPDNFTLSFKSKRSLYKQIGNAVPPFLSIVLAKMIKDILD